MLRLAGILFSLIATTLAGSGIVLALTMGYDTLQPLLAFAAAGAIAAIPATYLVTKAILDIG